MTQVVTNQRTLGKATRKKIKELIPEATNLKKVYDGNYLIKDSENNTLGTWQKQLFGNALIVIH
jgi:hypothetical protein